MVFKSEGLATVALMHASIYGIDIFFKRRTELIVISNNKKKKKNQYDKAGPFGFSMHTSVTYTALGTSITTASTSYN